MVSKKERRGSERRNGKRREGGRRERRERKKKAGRKRGRKGDRKGKQKDKRQERSRARLESIFMNEADSDIQSLTEFVFTWDSSKESHENYRLENVINT